MVRLLFGIYLFVSQNLLLAALNAKAAEIYNNNPPLWNGAADFGYTTDDVLAVDLRSCL